MENMEFMCTNLGISLMVVPQLEHIITLSIKSMEGLSQRKDM